MRRIIRKSTVILTLFMIFFSCTSVFAADANVHFGSEGYEPTLGTAFDIALYIETESGIGGYEVNLSYDADCLRYIDGATKVADGRLKIGGDLQEASGRFLMHFAVKKPGDTAIKVTGARVLSRDGNYEYNIPSLPNAPIKVKIEKVPFKGITINGTPLDGFEPATLEYSMVIDQSGDDIDVDVEGGTAADTEVEEAEEGERNLLVSARGMTDEGEQVDLVYTIKLIAGTPEQADSASDESSQTEALLSDAGSSSTDYKDEDDAIQLSKKDDEPDIYKRAPMSEEELESAIHENRASSMLKGLLVLGGLLIILAAIGGVIFLSEKYKYEGRSKKFSE